jgi:hypothetical protein
MRLIIEARIDGAADAIRGDHLVDVADGPDAAP